MNKDESRESMPDARETTSKEAGWSVLATIQENPIPAALVGVGVAWMLFNRSSAKKSTSIRVREAGAPDQGRLLEGATDLAHRVQHTLEDAAGAAGEAAIHARDVVEDTARRAGGSVGHVAQQVGSSLGDASKRAGAAVQKVAHDVSETTSHVVHDAYDATTGFVGDTARGAGAIVESGVATAGRAERSVEKAYFSQPLPFGALLFAFGAAAGLAIPHSDREDELMGEAKEKLLRKVEEAARNVIERAEDGASELLRHEPKQAEVAPNSKSTPADAPDV